MAWNRVPVKGWMRQTAPVWLGAWTVLMLAGWLGSAMEVKGATRDREFELARGLFETGDYLVVSERLGEFIQRHPDSPDLPEAVLLRAQALIKVGEGGLGEAQKERFIEAQSLLQSRMEGAGRFGDQYRYWHGQAALSAGADAVAAESFASVQRSYPSSQLLLDAMLGEAVARHRMGDTQRSIELLSQEIFEKSAPGMTNDARLVQGKLLLGELSLGLGRLGIASNAVVWLGGRSLAPAREWQRGLLRARLEYQAGAPAESLLTITNLNSMTNLLRDAAMNARVTALHADALIELGRYDDGVRVLLANLSSNTPPVWRTEAIGRLVEVTAVHGGRPPVMERIEDYLRQATLDPLELSGLRLELGRVRMSQYYNLGESSRSGTNLLERARGQFELVATNAAPEARGEAALNLGWCYWEGYVRSNSTVALAGSLAGFESAAALLPESEDRVVARFKVGDIRYAMGEFGAAVTNYEAVVEAARSDGSIREKYSSQALYMALDCALRLEDRDRATTSFRRLQEWHPYGAFTARAFRSGRFLEGIESPAQGRALIEKYEGLYPDSPWIADVKEAIARLYRAEADWTNALPRYDQWVETYAEHPSRPRVAFERARAYAEAGQLTNAFEQFETFVADHPTNALAAFAQNWVADEHYNRGQFEKAELAYQKLFQNTNWPPSELVFRARLMAGRAAFGRGIYKDAGDYCTDLLTVLNQRRNVETNRFPQLEAEAYLLLGSCRLRQYQNDPARPPELFRTAINAFERVTQEYGGMPVAAIAWGELGNCYFQDAASNPASYTLAQVNYRNAYTNELAASDVRTLAGLGLAKVMDRQSALASGPDREQLRQSAGELYHLLFRGGHLREGETMEAAHVSEAGSLAARIAEDRGELEKAMKIYQKLVETLPALDPMYRQKIEDLAARLKL